MKLVIMYQAGYGPKSASGQWELKIKALIDGGVKSISELHGKLSKEPMKLDEPFQLDANHFYEIEDDGIVTVYRTRFGYLSEAFMEIQEMI